MLAFGAVTGSAAADTITGVSAGSQFSCAVLADASVQCWGADGAGQFGDDGISGGSLTPVTVPGVTGADTVTAGGDHACALTNGQSGDVVCWGRDDGVTPTVIEPETPVLQGASEVSAGPNFTCALVGTSVECWGDDSAGQFGDGGVLGRSDTPVQVLTGATSVSAGGDHACALISGGTVTCWGIADGGGQPAIEPPTDSGLTGVVAVSAGNKFTCAVLSDHSVDCWGDDSTGQLGDGATLGGSPTPVPVVGVAGATAVSAGGDHACALISDQPVQCWGAVDAGAAPPAVPNQISGTAGATDLATGDNQSCAVLSDDSVDCWGGNDRGQLGDATTSSSAGAVPLQQSLDVIDTGAGTGTTTTSPAGTPCGSGATECFDHGTTVTVTAAPTGGSAFEGLTGGCTATTETCMVTLENAQAVTARFGAPPQVSRPTAGLDYPEGSAQTAGCTAAAATTLSSCTVTLDGQSIAVGASLTTVPGVHTVTVTATDADGGTQTASSTFSVSAPPVITITGPQDGATYLWTAVPTLTVACDPDPNSSLQSCTATADGSPVALGSRLPNSVGSHTVTVTATDTDGLSSTRSSTYIASLTLVAPPPVSIVTPRQGATYHLGQVVKADYSCRSVNQSVKTCSGTVADGQPVNTGSLGTHRFTVTAHDTGGESTSETISYRVVPTTNRFTVSRVKAAASGVIYLTVTVPGPGRIALLADAFNAARGASGPLARRFVYAAGSLRIHRGGAVPITIEPGSNGRALVRLKGGAPVVTLTVTYTPTGGRPRVVRPARLRIR